MKENPSSFAVFTDQWNKRKQTHIFVLLKNTLFWKTNLRDTEVLFGAVRN